MPGRQKQSPGAGGGGQKRKWTEGGKLRALTNRTQACRAPPGMTSRTPASVVLPSSTALEDGNYFHWRKCMLAA